jgi:fucose 4-O-acetylase-like acetyltransferase
VSKNQRYCSFSPKEQVLDTLAISRFGAKAEEKSMGKKRLYNIDLIKGLLIISVIIGHIILGKVETTFARYIIYSFHMPLFIAVSGFLINRNTLGEMTFWDILKKYFPRLLIPWGIAVIAYATIVNHNRILTLGYSEIVRLYLKSFIKPYYHLWFILGFLSYIFIVWIFLKLHFNSWMMIVAALIISIISKFELIHINNETIAKVVDTIHYDFRIYNLLFFILGMLLKDYISRNEVPKIFIRPAVVLTLIGTLLCIYLFYHDSSTGKRMVYFLLNIPFAVACLSLCYKDFFPRCSVIEFIGQNSMAFYLWHVIAKLAATSVAGSGNSSNYYIYSVVFLILLYVLIYFLSKISFINKYLFGALRK